MFDNLDEFDVDLADSARYSFAKGLQLLTDLKYKIGGLVVAGQIDLGLAIDMNEQLEEVKGLLRSGTIEYGPGDDSFRYSDGRPLASMVQLAVEPSDVQKIVPLDSAEAEVFPDLPGVGMVEYTWHPERDDPRDRGRVLTGHDIPDQLYCCTDDGWVAAVNCAGRYKVIVTAPGFLDSVSDDAAGW